MNSGGFARITAESKQRLILYSPKSSSHPAVRLDGEALCRHCYRFIPATATGETTNAIRLAGYQIASGTISPCQNHLTFKALLLSVKFHCLCPQPTSYLMQTSRPPSRVHGFWHLGGEVVQREVILRRIFLFEKQLEDFEIIKHFAFDFLQ